MNSIRPNGLANAGGSGHASTSGWSIMARVQLGRPRRSASAPSGPATEAPATARSLRGRVVDLTA